ncbi:MAG: PHP domain-containing protein [Oscillospiraceae bacterium]|nr:PHP domain-containing protein [Oscillospiraceae bacterium]
MDIRYLLPPSGNFYKANLHCHTVISDGVKTPEQIKADYMAHGYSVVAFTDHRRYVDHSQLTDENFLAISAYEADMDGWETDRNYQKTYHINFYALDPTRVTAGDTPLLERRYSDVDYLNGFVAQMAEKGFLACYNHPYWSLQNYDDYKGLRGFFAMEIYNYGCEIDGLYGYHPQAYDEMLRAGARLSCLMTDDNHNAWPDGHPLCDSYGGFTMISAPALTYPDILQALQKGAFYSSMGPAIEALWLEGRTVHIKCSPVQKIYMINAGRNCQYVVANPGESVCEAAFPLKGNETYFRIDCRDEKGLHACTNAYYLDELFLK